MVPILENIFSMLLAISKRRKEAFFSELGKTTLSTAGTPAKVGFSVLLCLCIPGLAQSPHCEILLGYA